MAAEPGSRGGLAPLVLGAVGIVYGDIGTSVLYAFKALFAGGRVPLTPDNVLGLLSMLFWALTIVVSLKYVTLVLRADNHGEGGLVAMLALASNAVRDRPGLRRVLLVVGVFGAGLFYGDGVITPAISVLSAMEGATLLAPAAAGYIVPAALAIVLALFMTQRRGTAGMGRLFGPVMVVWFLVIGAAGLVQVLAVPDVLAAIDPRYAGRFAAAQPVIAFVVLSALVLCLTGAESLYADLGHFGRRPIRVAWFSFVMPALLLNYFGQGALLLRTPDAVRNPFFLLLPDAFLMVAVALATLAAVIASQAMITGAFSVTRQLVQLGYLPRLRIVHTSVSQVGQVYLPFVNWALCGAVLLAVVNFRSSGALAAAYGVAVCGLMLMTTLLAFFVIRFHWRLPLLVCVGATTAFFVVDALFLSSALLKVPHGGWFPLLIATGVFVLIQTWRRGQALLAAHRSTMSVDLRGLLDALFEQPPARVEGTAVFFTSDGRHAPVAFLHNLKHNKVLHEHNLFLTIRYHEVPRVPDSERREVVSLGHHCWHIVLHYGFKNEPNVPADLAAVQDLGFHIEPLRVSYFLGADKIQVSGAPGGMRRWRKRLFAHLHRNAGLVQDHLRLPANAVVAFGTVIEI